MSGRLVVAAFPGTGKTHLANLHSDVCDSDSSTFSWEWQHPEVRVRRRDWPDNYIKHIRFQRDTGYTVLVSTHEEVRQALVAEGIGFLLVYPRADLRAEYLGRMRARGSFPGLIEKIDNEWLSMMKSCQSQAGCAHVVLGPGEFLRYPL